MRPDEIADLTGIDPSRLQRILRKKRSDAGRKRKTRKKFLGMF
jgi:hypothetical protein